MDQIIWTPRWVRGGKIEEIVWIGKDVLGWCIGLYIVFFHVVRRRQTLRWCWCHATGDGARCLAGHASAPILAFSERSLDPRILVLAYPSMTRICECARGCGGGYQAIAFTSRDHLVSLGAYPDFPMIVWCWRTGEKIAIVGTSMRDEVGQIVRITPIGRTVVGQMGSTCGRLFTWELDVVGKVVVLKDHEVRLPGEATIHGFDWCPASHDPLLAVTDRDGHVYLSNCDGTEIRRIVLSQRCGICEDIETPAVCWYRDGIVLKTTFCQIRYYKRDPKSDGWRKQWYVKSLHKPYILVAQPLRNDWFFYYTHEGNLMRIIFPESEGAAAPIIQLHLHRGDTYRFADFVYPWCHHLAVTDDLKELTVVEGYSGCEVSRVQLDMEGAVSAQVSHPDDPLVVVASDYGEMTVVGVADPELPTILARFRLQRKPLDLVRFSRSGRYLIAAQKETGNCYCINLRRDKPWSVMAQLQARRRLTDVVLYDDEDDDDDDDDDGGSLRVLALYVAYERFSVGQRLLVYRVSRRDGTIDERVEPVVVTLPGLFRELCHAPDHGERRRRLLIGSPYLERQLHALNLREFKDATLADAAPTGHHTRLARVFADRRWIVTCAYDGLVVVRDGTLRRVAAAVPAHHRLDSGSSRAIVSRDGDAVIALGNDGSLVAALIRREDDVEENETSASTLETENDRPAENGRYKRRKERILADYASLDPAIRASLTRARQEFPAADEGKTWEECRWDAQLRDETGLCAAAREAIARDLPALKATARRLLDANEIRPEIERLPVSAFDLDMAARDQKLKTAKDEREDVRMELEHLCYSTDRVAGWLKATFWEPQLVLGRSIFSFRHDTEVTNYPIMLGGEEPDAKDELRWAQYARDSTRNIVDDTFEPWRGYTDEQLRAELSKPIRVYREDERRMDVLLEEEERETDPAELTELRALDGRTIVCGAFLD